MRRRPSPSPHADHPTAVPTISRRRAPAHRARSTPFLLALLTLLATAPGSATGSEAEGSGAGEAAARESERLVPALAPIAYRLGSWRADVEFLTAEGEVRRTVVGRGTYHPALGGKAIEHRGQLVGTEIAAVSFLFRDRSSGELREAAVQTMGPESAISDVFTVAVEEERVVYTAEPRSRGGETTIFRAIDDEIGEDAFRTTGWVSSDGGETWVQTFRQVNRRVEE